MLLNIEGMAYKQNCTDAVFYNNVKHGYKYLISLNMLVPYMRYNTRDNLGKFTKHEDVSDIFEPLRNEQESKFQRLLRFIF